MRNFNRSANAKVLTALAATKSNGGDTIIACQGDSITAGKGATGAAPGVGNGHDGARVNAYPQQLAKWLNDRGCPAICADWFGSGDGAAAGGAFAGTDTYTGGVTRTGSPGWASSSGGIVSLGGLCSGWNGSSQTDTTSTILYTCPAGIVADRVSVFAVQVASGGGSYVVSLDGGADSGAVSTAAGADGAFTTAFSYSTATTGHTVSIRKSTGGAVGVYVLGVFFWNSSAPGFRIQNWGRSGWLTDDYVGVANGYAPGNQYYKQGAHLAIVELWANDAVSTNRPGTTATSITNLTTIINNHQAQGATVWIVSPQPLDPAGTISQSASDLYRPAVRDLALSKGCVLIEEDWTHQTYTKWNGSALAWDGNHPAIAGYGWKVDTLYGPMLRALRAAA